MNHSTEKIVHPRVDGKSQRMREFGLVVLRIIICPYWPCCQPKRNRHYRRLRERRKVVWSLRAYFLIKKRLFSTPSRLAKTHVDCYPEVVIFKRTLMQLVKPNPTVSGTKDDHTPFTDLGRLPMIVAAIT